MKKLIILFLTLILFKPDAETRIIKLTDSNSKEVNLSDFGYPVMLSCTLPLEAKVIQDYECYKIELTSNTAIESISWFNKNDYDFIRKEIKIRSASSMLEESKAKINSNKKLNIVEEYENGLHYVESYGYKDRPFLVFYFESVEQVYEVKCDPLFAYKEGELELILEVVNSIKRIPYCYDEVNLLDSNTYVRDFSREGFAFKIAIPKKAVVKTKRDFLKYNTLQSIYDIEFSDGSKFISVFQYSLPNEIDKSFENDKSEVKSNSRFIRMIYDDPYGYLAEFETTDYESDRYVFYYYHKTDSYFYVFKSAFEKYSSFYEEHLHPLTLDLATEMYLKVRDVKVGKICE